MHCKFLCNIVAENLKATDMFAEIYQKENIGKKCLQYFFIKLLEFTTSSSGSGSGSEVATSQSDSLHLIHLISL